MQLPLMPSRCPQTSDCRGEGVGRDAGEVREPMMYATNDVGEVRMMELRSRPIPSDRGDKDSARFLERAESRGLLASSMKR